MGKSKPFRLSAILYTVERLKLNFISKVMCVCLIYLLFAYLMFIVATERQALLSSSGSVKQKGVWRPTHTSSSNDMKPVG